jgi:hypothetical protein
MTRHRVASYGRFATLRLAQKLHPGPAVTSYSAQPSSGGEPG